MIKVILKQTGKVYEFKNRKEADKFIKDKTAIGYIIGQIPLFEIVEVQDE